MTSNSWLPFIGLVIGSVITLLLYLTGELSWRVKLKVPNSVVWIPLVVGLPIGWLIERQDLLRFTWPFAVVLVALYIASVVVLYPASTGMYSLVLGTGIFVVSAFVIVIFILLNLVSLLLAVLIYGVIGVLMMVILGKFVDNDRAWRALVTYVIFCFLLGALVFALSHAGINWF